MILWSLLDQLWQDQNVKLSKSSCRSGKPELGFFYSDFIVCFFLRLVQKKKWNLDFNGKTGALETDGKTTFQGTEYTNPWEQLAILSVGGHVDLAGFDHRLSCWILSGLDAPPLGSGRSTACQAAALPVWKDTAPRGGSLEEQNRISRLSLVSCVLSYEALSDCANFPRLTPNFGAECSRHQHQQNCCNFYCTYCVPSGTVSKESYMKKNNINMFNL